MIAIVSYTFMFCFCRFHGDLKQGVVVLIGVLIRAKLFYLNLAHLKLNLAFKMTRSFVDSTAYIAM